MVVVGKSTLDDKLVWHILSKLFGSVHFLLQKKIEHSSAIQFAL